MHRLAEALPVRRAQRAERERATARGALRERFVACIRSLEGERSGVGWGAATAQELRATQLAEAESHRRCE